VKPGELERNLARLAALARQARDRLEAAAREVREVAALAPGDDASARRDLGPADRTRPVEAARGEAQLK